MQNRPQLLCRFRLGSCASQAANQTGATLGALGHPRSDERPGSSPENRQRDPDATKTFCVQDLLRKARQRMMLDAVDWFSNISPRRFEKPSASI